MILQTISKSFFSIIMLLLTTFVNCNYAKRLHRMSILSSIFALFGQKVGNNTTSVLNDRYLYICNGVDYF